MRVQPGDTISVTRETIREVALYGATTKGTQ